MVFRNSCPALLNKTYFTYGVDQHCHTMVGCNLRQKQLQQGQHLKKRCKLWAPTWQKEMGWAPEAS